MGDVNQKGRGLGVEEKSPESIISPCTTASTSLVGGPLPIKVCLRRCDQEQVPLG